MCGSASLSITISISVSICIQHPTLSHQQQPCNLQHDCLCIAAVPTSSAQEHVKALLWAFKPASVSGPLLDFACCGKTFAIAKCALTQTGDCSRWLDWSLPHFAVFLHLHRFVQFLPVHRRVLFCWPSMPKPAEVARIGLRLFAPPSRQCTSAVEAQHHGDCKLHCVAVCHADANIQKSIGTQTGNAPAKHVCALSVVALAGNGWVNG